MNNSLLLFLAIIRKSLHELWHDRYHELFVSIRILVTSLILYTYFLPAMGMQTYLASFLFVGNVTGSLIFKMYYLCLGIGFERESKSLNYTYALPSSSFIISLALVVGITLKGLITRFPILLVGLWWFQIYPSCWIGMMQASLFLCLSVIFIAYSFFLLGLTNSTDAYMNKVWPYFLSPLYTTGGVIFTLEKVKYFFLLVGKVIVLNPLLHVSETLRTLFLEAPSPLSPLSSVVFIGVIIGVYVFITPYVVRRRLDTW